MARKKDNVVDLDRRRLQATEQLLKQLFDEHAVPLRSFLAARLGSRADLDDIVQDVFLRLAKMNNLIERMEKDRGSCRAYLFTIGSNLVMDLKRKHQVRNDYAQEKYQLDQEHSGEASPETILAARQELAIVKKAIFSMPPRWQKVFLLSRVELMSYKQIAEKLGVSVKQIEKYMSKALRCIRDAVQQENRREAEND
ncbi:sigma-70 family RNA polymerase sigma factor [Porticoccaceae bacterium LTM1]|nr:sigma-70 family RNA polymerase sigma factor [Porticoccaceae bacterium LTM1]